MSIIYFSRRSVFCLLSALLTGGLPAFSAQAAVSDWAVSDGGRMRLVALPADAKGVLRAGLQVEPAPGWITYWREPGESGIPPQIALAPGGGAALERVAYPVPKKLQTGGARDIGYDGPVTFPLTLSVDGAAPPAALTAQVFLGLCKDICIPFQAALTLDAAAPAGVEENLVLQRADASLPEGPSDTFSVRSFAVAADLTVLHLQLAVPAGTDASAEVIVTGPNGHVFTRLQNLVVAGTALTTDVAIGRLPKAYAIHGKQWGLLVKAGGRAMETTLAFD